MGKSKWSRGLVIGLWLLLSSVAEAEAKDIREVLTGRGIWANYPAAVTKNSLKFAAAAGVKRIHIMATDDIPVVVCGEPTKLPKNWGEAGLLPAVRAARDAGFDVIVTAYVQPSKDLVDRLFVESGLAEALQERGVAGLEYDLEGNWVASETCGFSGHAEAIQYLREKARSIVPAIPVGVTVHYGRLGDPKIDAGSFDWIAAQAYSKCPVPDCAEHRQDVVKPADKADKAAERAYLKQIEFAWDNPSNQPGRKQASVPRRLNVSDKPVILGLAAYQQKWNANHTESEALALSLAATEKLMKDYPNYLGYSWWGLVNARAPGPIRDFLLAKPVQ